MTFDLYNTYSIAEKLSAHTESDNHSAGKINRFNLAALQTARSSDYRMRYHMTRCCVSVVESGVTHPCSLHLSKYETIYGQYIL